MDAAAPKTAAAAPLNPPPDTVEMAQGDPLLGQHSGRTKHLGAGVGRGLQSAVGGVLGGAACLVAAPAIGAKEGGVGGFFKGLGAGVLGAIALPVAGVVGAVAEIGGGLVNTPEAVMAVAEGKEWDATTGTWVLYDLNKDQERFLSADADASLKAHVEARRKKQADAPAEVKEVNVKDTKMYEALGLQPDASDAAIKKAYYKQALKCHPDKHPGDAEKKAQFQQISAAYAVLSDPEARRRYDATGESDESPQQDPAVFFAMIFGSESFEKYVGELQMAQLVKGADGDHPDAAELDFVQRRRAVKLAVTLLGEIGDMVEGRVTKDEFSKRCFEDAAPLSATPFGATLTRVIARSYVAAANAHLSGNLAQSAFQSMQDTAHSAANYYKTGRESVAAMSNARAAQKAQEAAEASPQDQATRDTQEPLEAARYVTVSDDHGLFKVAHFATKDAALKHFGGLSYAFASVLFERAPPDGAAWAAAACAGEAAPPPPPWTPVRVYGTASACAKIKEHAKTSKDLDAKTLRESELRSRQGRMMGSVFEAAWRVSVLDMESTLRDATSKLFRDRSVDEKARDKRARAVKCLAKAFLAAADAAGHTETWQESLAKQMAAQAGSADAPPPPPEGADTP